MDILQHFNTFASYPAATVSHWLICGIAGVMFVFAENVKAIIVSLVLLLSFYIYEIVEFARIGDLGDIDLANGGAAFIVGVLASLAFIFVMEIAEEVRHHKRLARTRHRRKEREKR